MGFQLSSKVYRWLAPVCIAAVAAYDVLQLKRGWSGHPLMDDAFMFYRYAINLRHGLGMSWNPDGVHTYGETAPLWGLAVVVLSWLPLTSEHALMLGSWLCGLAAPVAMAWAVARNAKSSFMKSIWRVLPLVAVPLLLDRIYWPNTLTGMETMLAAALAAIFLGLAIAWVDGTVRPELPAAAGILLFLTRPEAALTVILVALIAGTSARKPAREVAVFLGTFVAAMLLNLLFCKLYFHSALPLSFYMKSGHAYEGYIMEWHPFGHVLIMLANCGIFLAVLLAFTRWSERRLIVMCVIPALATFAYLCTITQIMGWKARYYMPYTAFFVVPALLVLDARIKLPAREFWNVLTPRRVICLGAAALVMACLFLADGRKRAALQLHALDRRIEGRRFAYDPVRYDIQAKSPLPLLPENTNIRDVGDFLLAPLPSGVSIAASEVGYTAAVHPGATVIDLEGLNDTEIALHGFRVDELMARRPDIIWMPHTDYTYQRGMLLTSPLLLQQYDLYADAADYGIAVRKDSPMRAAIERQLGIFWRKFYPRNPMSEYLARSTSWTGRKYAAIVNR